MLKTIKLSIGYDHAILENLNLHVRAGEFICLIGLNGSGKSTLLQSLCGLQKPLDGQIYINGKNLSLLNSRTLAQYISIVLTTAVVIDKLSVFDLVAMGRSPHTNWVGRLTPKDKNILHQVIEQVGLSAKMNCDFNAMSDGEKQRAIIAKALAQDTPIVLLDEPTAYLDVLNRVHIMQLLKTLSRQMNKSFIVSTHELDLAMQLSDTIWLVGDKQLYVGTPEDLLLQNVFQRVFENENYRFDKTSGLFQIQHPMTKGVVSVKGEDFSAQLIKKAMQRKGFDIDTNATYCITAENNVFEVNGQKFSSIEDVLEFVLSTKIQNYSD